MRIHVHTIICSKQYLVRELWNGNKATGFIKRHDRLGRSTSLSLELENSLETTAHLITWVPDPILFARQCLSIPFFSLDIVNRIATRTPVKFGNEETCWAATRVHCSKVYYISFRLLYFVSGTKRIVLRRKLSYFVDRTHIILRVRKSWKFEAVCQLLYFGTPISSFFLREKSWTPFKEVFSQQRRKTVLERSFHRANSRYFDDDSRVSEVFRTSFHHF